MCIATASRLLQVLAACMGFNISARGVAVCVAMCFAMCVDMCVAGCAPVTSAHAPANVHAEVALGKAHNKAVALH